jgi:lysyl-tRNA synthetase class 2
MILEMVEKDAPIELSTLKVRAGLSGKQWDISIKVLTKQGLVKVTKEGESVLINLGN